MSRDRTLEEVFETVLYCHGVKRSGEIAADLHDEYLDWLDNVFSSAVIKVIDEIKLEK